MASYTNRNDLTYFSISEWLKPQVVFSYLEDVESNFLNVYNALIENDSIIQIDKSKDKIFNKFLKDNNTDNIVRPDQLIMSEISYTLIVK